MQNEVNSKEIINGGSKKPIKNDEPDILKFPKAIETNDNDTRSFMMMLKSSIQRRLIIFNCIKDNSSIFLIKLLLLIFTIVNYIATNGFFFTEKNIHQIYLDKGKYNFSYQIKYIILASLISSIFLYLAKLLIFITKEKQEEDGKSNSLMKRSLAFICISNCLFIFYWVYLGSITSTYINAKNHLVINSIITFLFCCILECFLSLISVILRRLSLRKSLPKIYLISQYINLL